MAETPEQRVARLEAELAQAKVEALQKQLAEARAQAGAPATAPRPAWQDTEQRMSGSLAEAQQLAELAGRHFGDGRHTGVRFAKSSAPADTNLAQPPRAVPGSYRLVAMPFRWWTVFALFMIAVSPIAVWIFAPIAALVVGVVTFLGVVGLALRRSALRLSLLKWGEVAGVVGNDVKSVGTYYSGTTVQNVRMAQAHGWTVERRWYSGPVTKTVVNYELRGTQASLTIRGLPYDDGVILADSRNPRRALCVSSFPYDLERDPSGNWTGRVPAKVKVGALLMLDVLLIWTAGMVFFGGLGANLW
ncbi:MAG: hypothetical protein QOI15_1352 [Pseudonocardiales bacterium]|nr:hypothetical protein [Pseudonocardiales bacterium]